MFTDFQRRISLFAGVLLLLTLSAPAQARQVASPTPETPALPEFVIQPVGEYPNGYFDVTLKPGESISLQASIRTTETSAPVSLRTYRTIAVHPVNGGFGAGSEADDPTGAATWVDYPAQAFELGPAESQEVSFTISVPADAAPGEYVAALVVQTDGPLPIPGMDTFDHVIRNALGITITVPGEQTFGIELGEPTLTLVGNATELTFLVTNTGNTFVRPTGDISITAKDGTAVAQAPVAMKAIYGGNTASLVVSLPQALPEGTYRVSASLHDAPSATSAALDNVSVTLAAPEVTAPVFTLDTVQAAPVGDPVQYVDVAVDVTNPGETIPTATVTLHVSRDGEPVETFQLAENRALPNGPTSITGRYIPAGGWSPGSYTFAVQITTTDLASGAEVILASGELAGAITVP